MNLTINLATRGRPRRMLETIETTLRNISNDDTLLMVSADSDDQPTIDALTNVTDRRVLPVVCPREDSLGAKYNRALVFAPADVYLVMVDYAPQITPGFDQKVLDAAAIFPDNIGVVYNHYCCASLPAINAVTATLANKMGGIYPTYFPFSFVDLWLDDMARFIDRIAFADIVIDRSGRKETMGRRDVKFWSVLLDALLPERARLAKSIIESPDFRDTQFRKALALQKFPLVAARSRLVSRASRNNAAWIDRNLPPANDEEEARYQRIKKIAEEKLRKAISEIEDMRARHVAPHV